MKADIDLDIGQKTFGSGLLPELIAVLRRSRPGDLVAVVGDLVVDEESIGPELETWCRFTGNPLLEATLEKGRARWVFRCGAVGVPREDERPVGARLWLYTNFDCNLHCDYCCVRSSPTAPRRELGLLRVQRIAREAADLAVKEIFVTGGEPFLLEDIGEILLSCAAAAPTTVLTNAMLFAAGARKPCERCPTIELFCKSVWTALRRTGTTSIVAPDHGRERAKGFSTLVSRGFACEWRRLFRPMPKPGSSVNSSTKRRLRTKTGSYAGSLCGAPPAKVSPSADPI
ncbi:MAG TPA: radical SAM protein [Candidatus Sulfotelmatobacter sp.]|nr:radical SAM protein [Candidatus Sulfotelmatobacter sp.]